MRREFAIAKSKPKRWPLVGVFVVAIIYGVWFTNLSHSASALYDTADASAKAASIDYTQSMSLGKDAPALTLLKNNPFGTETRWVYVSKWHTVPTSYVPSDLVTISVAHAASAQPFQMTDVASQALAKLFAAAEADGYPLVVSSAYRSASDQQELRDQTIASHGQAYADEYIALPGTSEHQTGLAVDINTYSAACTLDANTCAISATTAAWLKANAPNYGFILRYPEGSAALTGISHEPWHFRYVGPEAVAITKSGLVYDQIVRKVEPDWFK